MISRGITANKKYINRPDSSPVGSQISGLSYYDYTPIFLNLVREFAGYGGLPQSLCVITENGPNSYNYNYLTPELGVTGSMLQNNITVTATSDQTIFTWNNHGLVPNAAIFFSAPGTTIGGITTVPANQAPICAYSNTAFYGPRYIIDSNNFTSNTFSLLDANHLTPIVISTSGTANVIIDDYYNYIEFYADSKGYPITCNTAAGTQPSGFPVASWNGMSMVYGINGGSLEPSANCYVFQYEGEGTFAFNGWNSGASWTTANSSRIIVNYPQQVISVILCGTNTANYAKNWSLVYSPGSNTTNVGYRESLLNSGENIDPEFIARCGQMKVFRFMSALGVFSDWAGAADWPQMNINWDKMQAPDDWIYGYDFWFHGTAGLHYQYVCEICNKIGADLHLNLPTMASDTFYANLGSYLVSHLRPDLHVNLEWGNEIWNTGFPWTWNTTNDPTVGGGVAPPAVNLLAVGTYWGYTNSAYWYQGYNAFTSIFDIEQKRLLTATGIFRDKFAPRQDRIHPYMGCQQGYISGRDDQVLVMTGAWSGWGITGGYITEGNPILVSWNNHGFSNNMPFMIVQNPSWNDGPTFYWYTGEYQLPPGINFWKTYFVTNTTSNTFNIATEPNGVPLTSTGSSTYSFYASIPLANTEMWPVISITQGSGGPTTVNWTGHNKVPGSPLGFMAASLPVNMNTNTTYYVSSNAMTTNTFQLSLVPGGAPLTTLGSIVHSNVQPIVFGNYNGTLLDGFLVAPYYGGAQSPSWGGNPDGGNAAYTNAVCGPSPIPSAIQGTLTVVNSTTMSTTTGLGYSGNPNNSVIINFNPSFSNTNCYKYSNASSDVVTIASYTNTAVNVVNVGNPTVIYWPSSTWANGTPVLFQNTLPLPTGLTADAKYYVSSTGTSGEYYISANAANLQSYVSTSGSATGNVTIFGPTTFNWPNHGVTNAMIMRVFWMSWDSDFNAYSLYTTPPSQEWFGNGPLASGIPIWGFTTGIMPSGMNPGSVADNSSNVYWLSWQKNLQGFTSNSFFLVDNTGNNVICTTQGTGTLTLASTNPPNPFLVVDNCTPQPMLGLFGGFLPMGALGNGLGWLCALTSNSYQENCNTVVTEINATSGVITAPGANLLPGQQVSFWTPPGSSLPAASNADIGFAPGVYYYVNNDDTLTTNTFSIITQNSSNPVVMTFNNTVSGSPIIMPSGWRCFAYSGYSRVFPNTLNFGLADYIGASIYNYPNPNIVGYVPQEFGLVQSEMLMGKLYPFTATNVPHPLKLSFYESGWGMQSGGGDNNEFYTQLQLNENWGGWGDYWGQWYEYILANHLAPGDADGWPSGRGPYYTEFVLLGGASPPGHNYGNWGTIIEYGTGTPRWLSLINLTTKKMKR